MLIVLVIAWGVFCFGPKGATWKYVIYATSYVIACPILWPHSTLSAFFAGATVALIWMGLTRRWKRHRDIIGHAALFIEVELDWGTVDDLRELHDVVGEWIMDHGYDASTDTCKFTVGSTLVKGGRNA